MECKTETDEFGLTQPTTEPRIPSDEKLDKLLAIINERHGYSMAELSGHCRSLTGRTSLEGQPQPS